MGLLDGSDPSSLYNVGGIDPNTAGLLGFAAGMGQASAPSRLPISMGQAMSGGIQGMLGGRNQALQGNLLAQEVQRNQLANQFQLWRMGLINSYLNGGQAPNGPSGGLLSSGPPSAAAPPSGGGLLGGGSGGTGAAPVSAGGATGSAAAGGIPGGAVGASLLADVIGPTMGKIVANQYPGPTDFMKAYRDLVSAPEDLKPLAMQKLVTAAGDRFQLMRNGWAFDKLTNQWMHMPELGTGITGTIGPNGEMSANVVPGAIPAISAVESARAGAKAQYEPLTTYDQFGNEIIQPRSTLQSAPAPILGVGTGLPPGTTGSRALNPTPLAFKAPSGQQPTQPGPQSTAPQVNPLASMKLEDVIPPGSPIPSRPAPPAGAFLGAPNPGTADIQKADAERLAKYNNQAAEGQKVYQDLGLLSGVLERGLNTNKLAPLWTDLTNVAQGMGLNNLIPKNYDPNDAAEFDKVATDLVFAALKQIPGQPRVTEITGLQRANPNLSLPRATNVAIMHSVLANQQWMDKRSDLATQYAAQYPGAPLGYFDARYNAKAPLADATEQLFSVARQNGWQFPGDKGTPSNPVTPFAADQRAQTIKRNYQDGMYGKVGSPAARAAAEKAYNAQ